MEALFRDFWWLLFPLGWMLIAILKAAGRGRHDERALAAAVRKLEQDR